MRKALKEAWKKQKWKILGVWLVCFSLLVCINIGQTQEGTKKSESEDMTLAVPAQQITHDLSNIVLGSVVSIYHVNDDNLYYQNGKVIHTDTKEVEDRTELYTKSETSTIVHDMTRFNQLDSSISGYTVGEASLGRAGCVPSGLTTMIDHFLGTDWNPTKVATDLYNQGLYNGYYNGQFVPGVYQINNTIRYISEKYGIPEVSTLSDDEMVEGLKNGKVVCADVYVNNPAEFHFATYARYEVVDGVEYTYSYDSWIGATETNGTRVTIQSLIGSHINMSHLWASTIPFNDACWYVFG